MQICPGHEAGRFLAAYDQDACSFVGCDMIESLLQIGQNVTLEDVDAPAGHIKKTYVVKVAGTPKEEALDKLRAGVSIATDDGKRVKTGPASVRVVKEATNPWYEVTLIEGRNRQIRRMFEAVGHHVEKIKRVRYGPLSLDVPPGEFRSLTLKEIERLKSASKGSITKAKKSVS